MKELLIIRSVSFQQLDKNLVAIIEKYPDYKISLLTHEHGVFLAQKYKDINKIYVYPYTSGFQLGKKVADLKGKIFDTVIIPVTNLTGVGFFNVLLFSLSIRSKKRIVCNVISELWEITPRVILGLALMNWMIAAVSKILTAIVAIPVLLLLPVKLLTIQKKGLEK